MNTTVIHRQSFIRSVHRKLSTTTRTELTTGVSMYWTANAYPDWLAGVHRRRTGRLTYAHAIRLIEIDTWRVINSCTYLLTYTLACRLHWIRRSNAFDRKRTRRRTCRQTRQRSNALDQAFQCIGLQMNIHKDKQMDIQSDTPTGTPNTPTHF